MPSPGQKIKYYTLRNIDTLPQYHVLTEDEQFALHVVGRVLPFRVNNYVVNELIDWAAVPDDPIFQLTFMQEGMLNSDHFDRMAAAIKANKSPKELNAIAKKIRMQLNPHPAGQMEANVPIMDEEVVPGIQHKYAQTCLVFPRQSQTCHSYCTFCFRWPQFTGMVDLKFATDESRRFQTYLKREKGLTDVLFTGGDPMVMNARNLATYIEPLLQPAFDHIQSIRIGTKSLGYWPARYTTDKDADDVLRLFEKVVKAGKHLAVMAHYNHWRELSTPLSLEAVRRVRATGAQIRTQSPLIRHINDNADVWARMWKEQVKAGCIPYYMFMERDTGSKRYFSIPLFRAWEIYQAAYQQVSGLARTVRGPSMSAYPGKVAIEGIATINGQKVFVLSMLQSRQADQVKQPFFAQYDPNATWLTDLKPAFGQQRFFFEQEDPPAPGVYDFTPEIQVRNPNLIHNKTI